MCKYKKILLSLFIAVSVGISFLPSIDEVSLQNNDVFLKRATIAFAVAKGMNGAISFLQGTEVGGSVVFANATFAVGELLDPLNDMVERFSWVMLASSVALGIENILIQLGAAQGLKYIFLGFGVFLGLTLWLKRLNIFSSLGLKIFLILALCRFIMPVTEFANTQIYAYFTKTKYENSSLSLQKTNKDLVYMKNDIAKANDAGSKSSISSFFKNPTKSVRSNIDAMLNKLEKSYEDMKNLMVIFIFQSILIPILSLWLGYKMLLFILSSKNEFLKQTSDTGRYRQLV